MATEFTATVMEIGGDYTTLTAAEAGLQNNLTLSTIKVFSISTSTPTTIAPGDAVTGLTSGATGVCVLVNRARTQILIKSIVGTFQSGEVVKKTSDASRIVTLSNSGGSPICGINITGVWNSAEMNTVGISGWTTSAINYINIYTSGTGRHNGKYNTTTYRIETVESYGLVILEDFCRIDGIQVKLTVVSGYVICIGTGSLNNGAIIQISNSIIRGVLSEEATLCKGIAFLAMVSGISTYKLWNNIIYGFKNGAYDNHGISFNSVGNVYCYNNTIYNCYIGYRRVAGTVYAKNNIAQGCTYGFYGTYDAASTNNASDIVSDAPGSNPQTGTVSFVSIVSGSEDLHLIVSDTIAKDQGVDLSGDANLPITTDIDEFTRSGTWDIGADEYETPTVLIPLFMRTYQNRRNV